MSDEYICKRCNTHLSSKQNLKLHLNRKKECVSVNEDIPRYILLDELFPTYKENAYECDFCKRPFNASSNRYRHRKICDQNPDVKSKTSTNDMQRLYHKVKELELENKQLRASNASTASTEPLVQPVIVNNIINTVNNTYNVTYIHNILDSHVDHLESDFKEKCIDGRDTGIGILLDAIYFNPEVPQNQIVRLKSLNTKLVEVYNGTDWVVRPLDESIKKMLQKTAGVAMVHFQYNELVWSERYTRLFSATWITKRTTFFYYKKTRNR